MASLQIWGCETEAAGFGFVRVGWSDLFSYVARGENKDTKREEKSLGKRYMLLLEILVFVISTCCFVVGVIYSAMPYHGRLGSKLQALSTERQIPLNHTNFLIPGFPEFWKT